MYSNIHEAVKEAAKYVRERFNEANISHMHFEIETSGRVNGGEVKIQYSIGEYGSEVTGGDLMAVLAEFMRRKGWTAVNAPRMLESPSSYSDDLNSL